MLKPLTPEQEIEKLKSEKRQLQTTLRKVYKELFSQKDFEKLIHGTLAANHAHRSPGHKLPVIGATRRAGPNASVPVLVLSDIHFDENVMASGIGGLNSFNRKICIDRLHKCATGFVSEVGSLPSRPAEAVILLGGDLLSGVIHQELAETQAPILESVIHLVEVIADIIDLVASGTDGNVRVVGVVGNHGRLNEEKRFKLEVFHNFEWLIYQLLRKRFADNKHISFLIPDGLDAHFDILGNRHLLTHGDQLRGGAPARLVAAGLKKMAHSAKNNKPVDTIVFGHWHSSVFHKLETHRGTQTVISNGSVKGPDEYAFKGNFDLERWSQWMYVVDSKHGIVMQQRISD